MAGAVASSNQPSIEGQHGHRATQRQEISGVVHLEADGLFECRNNQAHNNHIGQIVLQALEAVHRENVGVLFFATLQAWIEVQFAHPLTIRPQNLSSYLRHILGPNKSLACNAR